jgi:hypothetical protein
MKKCIHKWTFVGDLVVAFTTEGDFLPDDVWDRFVADVKNKSVDKYLATALGAVKASSVQRKKIADVVKEKGIPIGVVSDDRLIRGMVTAVSWLGVDVKAFSWAELEAAVVYLKMPAIMTNHVRMAIDGLKAECAREESTHYYKAKQA